MNRTQPIQSVWNLFTAAKNRLASGRDTDAVTLDRLGHASSEQTRIRVAENEGSSADTLQMLSRQASGSVRSAVAQNSSTAAGTNLELANDENADVRFAMAENTRTSTELLKLLAQDENPFVSGRAQRTQLRVKAEAETQAALVDANLLEVERLSQITSAPHPVAWFFQNLLRGKMNTAITDHNVSNLSLADLAVMPKRAQLLVAFVLNRNDAKLQLLSGDSDVDALLKADWLLQTPCSTLHVLCYKVRPDVWRSLNKLKSAFLNDAVMGELKAFRHEKTMRYPWIW